MINFFKYFHKQINSSYILATFSILSIVGCSPPSMEEELHELMGEWYLKTIVVPDNMDFIQDQQFDNELYTERSKSGDGFSNKLTIIHYFLADCSDCTDRLVRWNELISNMEGNSNLEFKFIAESPHRTYIEYAMANSKFKLPIHYDSLYEFKSINNLPDEPLYNTMLLNDQDQLLLVGAFDENELAFDYLERIIESVNNN